MWWWGQKFRRGSGETSYLSLEITVPLVLLPGQLTSGEAATAQLYAGNVESEVFGSPLAIGPEWVSPAWFSTRGGVPEDLVRKVVFDLLGQDAGFGGEYLLHNTEVYTGPFDIAAFYAVDAFTSVSVVTDIAESDVTVSAQAIYSNTLDSEVQTQLSYVAGLSADPCRGVCFFDAQNFRVLRYNGDRIQQLGNLPRRDEYLSNYTQSGAIPGAQTYWGPTAVLFGMRGYLVAMWAIVTPQAGVRWARYDERTGEWEDLSLTSPVTGVDFTQFDPVKFDPRRLFSADLFAPNASQFAAFGTLVQVTGQTACAFLGRNPQTGTPNLAFEIRLTHNVGWIGLTTIQTPAATTAAKYLKLAGDLPSIPGVPGTFTTLMSYSGSGDWESFVGSASVSQANYFVLVAYGVPPESVVELRNFKASPTPLNVTSPCFGSTINYRGQQLIHAYGMSFDTYIIRVDPDFTAEAIRSAVYEGQTTYKGQSFSVHQHHRMVGDVIPHRDRLLSLPAGAGSRYYSVGADNDGTLFDNKLYAFDSEGQLIDATKFELTAPPNVSLDIVQTNASLGVRTDRLPLLMAGGGSCFGRLFFVNGIAQLMRYDQRRRKAILLYDFAYEDAAMDAGSFLTTGNGSTTTGDYDFIMDRAVLPPATELNPIFRGEGLFGTGWWTELLRFEIVAIPLTGDSVLDAKLQTLVGRRGVYAGCPRYSDTSTKHWVHDESGYPRFSSYFNGASWEKLALPAGTEIAVKWSLAGARPPSMVSTKPVSLKVFEYDGSLFVIWTAAATKYSTEDLSGSQAQTSMTRAPTLHEPVPPSIIYRFEYDPETDSVALAGRAELVRKGQPLNASPAYFHVDKEAGQLWIVYENHDSTKFPVGCALIDLDTLAQTYFGEFYIQDRFQYASLYSPLDNRSTLSRGAITSYSSSDPHLYITDAEIADELSAPGRPVYAVKFRLYCRDASVFRVRAAFSFDAAGAGDPRPPQGFLPATAHPATPLLFAASENGEDHVFYHDVAADLVLPFDGFVQYELLPFLQQVVDKCDNSDPEVDLYVQGLVSGCGLRDRAIQVEVNNTVINVGEVPLPSNGCPECPSLGVQTPGAVLVYRGPLSIAREAVLRLCNNVADPFGLNPGCDLDTSLDGATMWITASQAEPALIICAAEAAPGQAVTFANCSLSTVATTDVVGTLDCTCVPFRVSEVNTPTLKDATYCLWEQLQCFRLSVTFLSPSHTSGAFVYLDFMDDDGTVVQTAELTATWNLAGNGSWCGQPVPSATTTFGTVISAVHHCTLAGDADGAVVLFEFPTITPFVRIRNNSQALDGVYPSIWVSNHRCGSTVALTNFNDGDCLVTEDTELVVSGTLDGSLGFWNAPGGSGSLNTTVWTVNVPLVDGDNVIEVSGENGNTESIVVQKLALSGSNIAVVENAGPASFTINRDDTGTGYVSVRATTADGSAIDGIDYTGIDLLYTLAPGTSFATVNVDIIDRGAGTEGDRTFVLNVAPLPECGVTFALGNTGSAAATEDAAFELFGTYNGGPATLLNAANAYTAEIHGDGATQSWTHLVPLEPGDNVISIDVPGDGIYVYTVTRVVWSVNDVTAVEGTTFEFTVTRTDGGSTILFGAATGDGTAVAGVDYTAISATGATLTGTGSALLEVQTAALSGTQGNRTFTLTITLEGLA